MWADGNTDGQLRRYHYAFALCTSWKEACIYGEVLW
jgi:hypothetical protein